MISKLFIYLFLALHLKIAPRYLAVTAEENDEVKIEVLFMPENCTKKSGKGDLLNAHYDGYLAEDGSKFYCR